MNDLRLGDCLEVMKTIPNGSIDLVLTSPPYNLGNDHHTGSKRHKVYNDDLPEEEYQKWQIEVLNEAYRITKESGSLFYNHKNRIRNGLSIIPYQWLFKTKWLIKQEIVWWNGGRNFDKIRFYPQTERIYWLAKNPETKLINPISLLDIWHISPVGTQQEHVRQFPLKLVKNILICFKKDITVIDFFMGSGTTGVACKELSRNFIGVEIEPKYFEIAKRRIDNTMENLL